MWAVETQIGGDAAMVSNQISEQQFAAEQNSLRIKNETDFKRLGYFAVEFHLTSFPYDGGSNESSGITSGTWYWNKQKPWDGLSQPKREWFQGQGLQPFYDSTVLYLSHYKQMEDGSYFENGQIDIHLTKQAQMTEQGITTQKGTWQLGTGNRIYGIYQKRHLESGSGNYTYTYNFK